MERVKKAVIAAAGYGTRFLPGTKVIQKEMLPLINAPVIHYNLEEVIESGVEEIIIVTRKGKGQIEEYLSRDRDKEKQLESQGKLGLIEAYIKLYEKAKITIIPQDENLPYGNGVPILCAREYLTPGEPFFYLYSDDIIIAPRPCCRQLLELYREDKESVGVIGVQEVTKEQAALYATINLYPGSMRIKEMTEKPDPDKITSLLVSFGRYLLPYRIFDYLSPHKRGKDGEVWTADAVRDLAKDERVLASVLDGEWLTTGDPLHFFKTNLKLMLNHPVYKEEIKNFIKTQIKE